MAWHELVFVVLLASTVIVVVWVMVRFEVGRERCKTANFADTGAGWGSNHELARKGSSENHIVAYNRSFNVLFPIYCKGFHDKDARIPSHPSPSTPSRG